VFNKLRFVGAWANRPRDISNLTRFVGRELERPLNWQVVGLDGPWTDWADCRVLYIASHKAPRFSDADVEKLRSFALAGGLIFTHADGGSAEFSDFVSQLAKRLFPQYKLAPLKLDHPIYTSVYHLEKRPLLEGVSNGSRLLLLHSKGDQALAWDGRPDKSHLDAFRLGTNVFIYATGKNDLHRRLVSFIEPSAGDTVLHNVNWGRIKWGDQSDPEPQAISQLSNWMWRQTGWRIDPKFVEARSSELKPELIPVAHLTGTSGRSPTPEEVLAVRAYVEAGGVLVIEPSGGSISFSNAVETELLPRSFPNISPRQLEMTHPLLAGVGPGMTRLDQPILRSGMLDSLIEASLKIFSFGKGHVIISRLDLSSGWLGLGTLGIQGYDTEYAREFAKNLILWTVDGQHDH
jgi:hypothetical protein